MLTSAGISLRVASQCLRQQARRNIAVSAVLAQKSEDPVQKLFLQKIKEFAEKKKASGGKMTDIPVESQRSLDLELARLEKQYKTTGVDMTKFPDFKFQDQPVSVTTSTPKDADPSTIPI